MCLHMNLFEEQTRIGSGLSFRGKILRVNYDSWFAIEEFLSRLSSLFDSVEKGALNFVAELFGLNVAV